MIIKLFFGKLVACWALLILGIFGFSRHVSSTAGLLSGSFSMDTRIDTCIDKRKLSADYSAAYNAAVLIIEYGRLSRRYALHSLIQLDPYLRAAKIFNCGRTLGLVISGLGKASDLFTFRRLRNA